MPPASGQHDDPASRPSPERSAADSLTAAFLLAGIGGFLDAFLYLDHGHVFAGAMTGNAVLFGISLLGGHGSETLHHALPLLAFICGVWLAEVLQNRVRHHAVTLGLACELLGLLLASFLPATFPDQSFVFLLCLVAAFQIASFRKAGPYSYNSTFITGDLRTAVVGLYEATQPGKRSEGLQQAREFGFLLSWFLAGAVLGATLAHRLGNHALWVPCGALALVLLSVLRRVVPAAAAP